jgi:hypothetical protein
MGSERPSDVRPDRHLEARAEEHRRDDQVAHRGNAVDLRLEQRVQDARTLRVPDQHHAPPVVVVGDVVLPGVDDVVEREVAIDVDRPARDQVEQRRQRHLPVNRREHPADRAEPRRLLADDEDLLELGRHQVAVAGLVERDRRVDVEAVELGLARRFPALDARRAATLDAGGVHVDVARVVVGVATAEPVRRVGVDLAHVAGVGRVAGAADGGQHEGGTGEEGRQR